MRNAHLSEEGKAYLADKIPSLKGSWQDKCDAVSQEMKDKFDYILENGEALRSIVRRINSLQETIKDINAAIPADRPWEVRDGHYFIEAGKETFKLSIEDADALFADFSRHGANLSGQRIRQKYGMSAKAWNHIKSKLELYKDSHVFSPHTSETLSEDELDERVVEVMGKHFDDRVVNKMVVTGEKMFKKEAQRAMKYLYNQEYYLSELQKFIEGWRPTKVDIKLPPAINQDWKHYFISDIHIGKIGTDQVLERIEAVKQEIISSPEGIAYLTIGGDLGETFAQDGNHPGQIIHGTEDKWGRGFDLMLNIAKVFEDMLLDIRKAGKVLKVHGITGNHGRVTGKKEDDIERTAELVIYELIKRAISNTDIELEYHKDSLHLIDIGSVRFVMIHGDAPLGNQTPERLLLPHQRQGAYHVLGTGDRHTLQMKEGFGYTYIRTPALAGKGSYDKSMNLHSEPGFLVFKPNGYGTVDIDIKRLK